jgi:hypothetical protein
MVGEPARNKPRYVYTCTFADMSFVVWYGNMMQLPFYFLQTQASIEGSCVGRDKSTWTYRYLCIRRENGCPNVHRHFEGYFEAFYPGHLSHIASPILTRNIHPDVLLNSSKTMQSIGGRRPKNHRTVAQLKTCGWIYGYRWKNMDDVIAHHQWTM